MRRLLTRCAAFAGLGACLLHQARADTVTFDLDREFSGAQAPAGTGPWLRATFDDGGSAGSVTVKLTSLLSGSEFVRDGWFVNLDPVMDPMSLNFSALSIVSGSVNLGAVEISTGVNEFKADGDGKYDVLVEFQSDEGAGRFGAGDAVQFSITGIASLTAHSFDFLSLPAGGHGPFKSAAHVQNTTGAGSGGSGWIATDESTVTVTVVPLPAAAWMGMSLLGGVGGVGFFRRRRLVEA
jgi:hypothetical protein